MHPVADDRRWWCVSCLGRMSVLHGALLFIADAVVMYTIFTEYFRATQWVDDWD